jgi:hypothetical protein
LAAGETPLVVVPGSVGGDVDFELRWGVVLSGGVGSDDAHLDAGVDVRL